MLMTGLYARAGAIFPATGIAVIFAGLTRSVPPFTSACAG